MSLALGTLVRVSQQTHRPEMLQSSCNSRNVWIHVCIYLYMYIYIYINVCV